MMSPYRAIFCLVFLTLILTACGPFAITPVATSAPSPDIPPTREPVETLSALSQYYIPPYYMPGYIRVVEDSKKEDGLAIYSIMAAGNWAPIIEAFNAHYPWIKVTTSDLNAAEVFTRYDSEIKTGVRAADLVVSSDQVGWQTFIANGQNLAYVSREDKFMPGWAKPTLGGVSTGLYTVSSDPMIIIYNKTLVSAPPQSMKDLSQLVLANPAEFKNQIVTYDAELNLTGFGINWFWLDRAGEEGWKTLAAIGQAVPSLKTSAANMVDAVGKGEAKLGYFVSAISVFPKLADYPNLGWSYISDGQPIFLRFMAITQGGASPNSAKLMLDFILSQEGQLALEKGGLTPYRNDIFGIPTRHLDLIGQRIGDKNLVFLSLDSRFLDSANRAAFIARWKDAVQKPEPTPTPIPTPVPIPTPTP